MTWMSFLNSPCTSLTTWIVPLGKVSVARRWAMAARVASMLGYCAPNARRYTMVWSSTARRGETGESLMRQIYTRFTLQRTSVGIAPLASSGAVKTNRAGELIPGPVLTPRRNEAAYPALPY